MITNKAISRILELLKEDVTHIGIGIGLPPSDSSQSLDNELSRKIAESQILSNKLKISATWTENEGNGFVYKNAGCFGSGAGHGLNTGDLFAGAGIEISKDNTQSMTITIEIDVEAINNV